MANPNLTIQPDKARLTVTGKSWDDVTTDSGPGDTIEQITIDDIEELIDIELPDIPEDVPIIIGDLPGWEDPVIIIDWPEGPEIIELPGLDLDDLDLDWEIDLSISDLDDLYLVDVDLNIEILDLPDEIRIMHVPNKTSYHDGDHIDLDGLMVRAYKDGEPWEDPDEKYHDGYIPAHEWGYQPKVASVDSGAMEYNIAGGYFCHLSTNFYDRTFTQTAGGDAYAGLLIDNATGWHNPIICSDNPEAIAWHCEDVKSPMFTRDFGISGTLRIKGMTIYYGSGYGLREGSSGTGLSASGIATLEAPLKDAIEPLVYGDGQKGVTVSWPRYGDGKVLTATFSISVM